MKIKITLVFSFLLITIMGYLIFENHRTKNKKIKTLESNFYEWDIVLPLTQVKKDWEAFGDIEKVINNINEQISVTDKGLDVDDRYLSLFIWKVASAGKIEGFSNWEDLIKKLRSENGSANNLKNELFGNQKFGITESDRQISLFAYDIITNQIEGCLISKKSNTWVRYNGSRKTSSAVWSDISNQIIGNFRIRELE
jgi:hypothetical protein